MKTEELLGKIADLAPRVASQHEEYLLAIATEGDRRASLLSRAIDLARPALPAMSSSIPAHDGVRLPVRGVLLSQDRYFRGLWLTVHGELLLLDAGGVASLTPREVLLSFEIAPLLENLLTRLVAEADGNKATVTREATQTVARLDAILTLIRPAD